MRGDYFKQRVYINPGRPGPWVTATRGRIWPQPKVEKPHGSRYSILLPQQFIYDVSDFLLV